MVTLVYTVVRGFVTDFGEPVELVAEDGTVTTLPRYGVWKDTGRGKREVVLTTNDFAEATRCADTREVL